MSIKQTVSSLLSDLSDAAYVKAQKSSSKDDKCVLEAVSTGLGKLSDTLYTTQDEWKAEDKKG